MNFFKIVKGQEQASELLGGSVSKNRLAHAYLFAGPSGVGRLTAALELSAAWMCSVEKSGYCGKCHDCTRIFRFQHPDVRLTIPGMGSTEPEDIAALLQTRVDDGITPVRFPGNTVIAIDQIRELGKRLSLKAYENKGHIEIIIDAERMGIEASNALLKTLEEPPCETIIILISSIWSALLPTVRSRSHMIRFNRLHEDLIADILIDRKEMTRDRASEIALVSDGSPGNALLHENGSSLYDTEENPSEILQEVVDSTMASSVISMASKLSRKLGREGSLEFTVEMQSFLHDLRRKTLDMKPFAHTDRQLDSIDIPDDKVESIAKVFRTAEIRLRGNGMSRIVLTTAFLGTWNIIRKTGKDSVS